MEALLEVTGRCEEADGGADAQLVARFRAGDAAAFEALYRRHAPVLLRHLARITGNETVAEELGQEAFLRAARRLPDDVGDRFRAWLLRVGGNLAYDHLRSTCRQRRLEAQVVERGRTERSVDFDIDLHEDRRSIGTVLDRLPSRYREVLVHREVEGHDYLTIARLMGISMTTLQTLLYRARGRFRDEYRREHCAA